MKTAGDRDEGERGGGGKQSCIAIYGFHRLTDNRSVVSGQDHRRREEREKKK